MVWAALQQLTPGVLNMFSFLAILEPSIVLEPNIWTSVIKLGLRSQSQSIGLPYRKHQQLKNTQTSFRAKHQTVLQGFSISLALNPAERREPGTTGDVLSLGLDL